MDKSHLREWFTGTTDSCLKQTAGSLRTLISYFLASMGQPRDVDAVVVLLGSISQQEELFFHKLFRHFISTELLNFSNLRNSLQELSVQTQECSNPPQTLVLATLDIQQSLRGFAKLESTVEKLVQTARAVNQQIILLNLEPYIPLRDWQRSEVVRLRVEEEILDNFNAFLSEYSDTQSGLYLEREPDNSLLVSPRLLLSALYGLSRDTDVTPRLRWSHEASGLEALYTQHTNTIGGRSYTLPSWLSKWNSRFQVCSAEDKELILEPPKLPLLIYSDCKKTKSSSQRTQDRRRIKQLLTELDFIESGTPLPKEEQRFSGLRGRSRLYPLSLKNLHVIAKCDLSYRRNAEWRGIQLLRSQMIKGGVVLPIAGNKPEDQVLLFPLGDGSGRNVVDLNDFLRKFLRNIGNPTNTKECEKLLSSIYKILSGLHSHGLEKKLYDPLSQEFGTFADQVRTSIDSNEIEVLIASFESKYGLFSSYDYVDKRLNELRLSKDVQLVLKTLPHPVKNIFSSDMTSLVRLRRSVIHGDLNFKNIVIVENEANLLESTPYLIDFASTNYGPTVIDWADMEVGLWLAIAEALPQDQFRYEAILPAAIAVNGLISAEKVKIEQSKFNRITTATMNLLIHHRMHVARELEKGDAVLSEYFLALSWSFLKRLPVIQISSPHLIEAAIWGTRLAIAVWQSQDQYKLGKKSQRKLLWSKPRKRAEGVFSQSITEQYRRKFNREVKRMTEEQGKHLKKLVYGKKRAIITGPPGTGKTLIAAQLTIDRSWEKTLFLCHNPLLASHVETMVQDHMAQVYSFEAWIKALLGEESVTGGREEWTSYRGPDQLSLRKASRLLEENQELKFQVIIVDEAQDFLPEWWNVISCAMEQNTNLYLFCDDRQSLREYPTPTGTSKLTLAESLSLSKLHELSLEDQPTLEQNVRNTKPVQQLMKLFCPVKSNNRIQNGGARELFVFKKGSEKQAITRAVRWLHSLDPVSSVLALTPDKISLESLPLTNMQILVDPDSAWQSFILREFGKVIYDPKVVALLPYFENLERALSHSELPTSEDIELVCDLSRRVRECLSIVQLKRLNLSWQTRGCGAQLLNRNDNTPSTQELLSFLGRKAWANGVPPARVLRFSQEVFPEPETTFGVCPIATFKGMEADSILLYVPNVNIDNQELLVGISRARMSLALVVSEKVNLTNEGFSRIRTQFDSHTNVGFA